MFESTVLAVHKGRIAIAQSIHPVFERLTDAALAASGMRGTTR
jgi:hypothetical protein